MPAKDIYHTQVINALIKDGWIITHDPLRLQWGPKDMYVDLGAEQMVAAEKAGRKIAVEIKSFIGPSEIEDLKNAVGQFILYRAVMQKTEADRDLFLAVRHTTFLELFDEPVGKLVVESEQIKLVVFEPSTEEIVQWIP